MACFNCFLDSSVGKESACNSEDPGSVPGSGRSAGEGKGYPLQYSWASNVAQLAWNPPAMRETWVWSLDWETPLEKEMGYPLQYSGLENSTDCIVHGVAKSRTWLNDSHFHFPLPSTEYLRPWKKRGNFEVEESWSLRSVSNDRDSISQSHSDWVKCLPLTK